MLTIETKHKIRTFIFNIRAKTTLVIKRKLRRYIVHALNLNRPTSYPFITGDGFRALAQHILDEASDMDAHKVEEGDVVFVNADYLSQFFSEKHPHIKHKYILITHNSDLNITKEHTNYIDDKIVRWFAKNVCVAHDRITPIPIGLVNTFCNHIGKTSDLPKLMALGIKEKEPGISFGFSLISGKERMFLHNLLTEHPLGFHVSEKNQRAYFEKMGRYMFAASPEGNGADCHRTWEAIHMRSVPILKRNYFIEHFKNLGLPMLIIDDWNELKDLSAEDMQKIYAQFEHAFNHEAMFMDYWMNLIIKEKEHIYGTIR